MKKSPKVKLYPEHREAYADSRGDCSCLLAVPLTSKELSKLVEVCAKAMHRNVVKLQNDYLHLSTTEKWKGVAKSNQGVYLFLAQACLEAAIAHTIKKKDN
jgi:hypothetical protein